MQFYGEYTAKLDDKGRVGVPMKLREGLDERERDRFMLMALPEGCLALFTQTEFEDISRQIAARLGTSIGTVSGRAMERELYRRTTQVQCDKQGRILIPETLRAKASLERESSLTFIGARNRIEVWSTEALDAQPAQSMAEFDALIQSVLG